MWSDVASVGVGATPDGPHFVTLHDINTGPGSLATASQGNTQRISEINCELILLIQGVPKYIPELKSGTFFMDTMHAWVSLISSLCMVFFNYSYSYYYYYYLPVLVNCKCHIIEGALY